METEQKVNYVAPESLLWDKKEKRSIKPPQANSF